MSNTISYLYVSQYNTGEMDSDKNNLDIYQVLYNLWIKI